MWEAIEIGLSGLALGARNLALPDAVMMGVGFLLLYLGIKKGFEPLLLVPIGFGAFLVNLPLSGLMEEGGIFRILFNTGIANELYPLLIFVGIGAMTDFGPLLENPKILLLGAAGQFGIFLTLALSLVFGFSKLEAAAIGVIGACDGPTAIYVTSKYAPQLLAAVSVAAYSYMSLVPIIQPPIIRLLTTKEEKVMKMEAIRPTVSQVSISDVARKIMGMPAAHAIAFASTHQPAFGRKRLSTLHWGTPRTGPSTRPIPAAAAI